MLRPVWCLLLYGLWGWAGVANAADPLAWLPREANAVAWVNVARVYESRLAIEQEWSQKSREAFLNQQAIIPPGVKTFLATAELDYGQGLHSLRESVIVEPAAGMTLTAMAALADVELAPLGDKPGLLTSRGVYVVEAAPTLWLAAAQGGRQAVGRWLKTGSSVDATPLIGPLRRLSADHDMVMVFDVADSVTPAVAAQVVAELDPVPGAGTAATYAKILSTIARGTLAVKIDTAIRGRVEVEFGESVEPLKNVVASLVPAILNGLGVSGAAGEGWTWAPRGNVLIGEGDLSATQLRRLLSLVYNPAIDLASGSGDAAGSGTPTSPAAESPTIVASRKYLRSIRSILDDLQDTLKRTRDNHAVWYERSGRRIDDLPMVNVDPDLLTYGGRVSNSLRYQGQAQRVMNVRAGGERARTGAGNSYATGVVGPYGGWVVGRTTPVTTAAIDATANEQAMEVRFSEWKQIEDGYNEIRRLLTMKLNAEF